MRERLVFGISPGFPELSRCQGQVTHVLLTRSPLGTTWCCHQVGLARLACVKHAASVRPEPGSNSPSEIVEILRRTRRWRRRGRLRSHLDSTPSRTSRLTILPETSSKRMDGTRDQPGAARAGSSVVRMFQVPSLGTMHTRPEPAVPARCDGVEALAFHTLLSFQGASWNRPCDSPGGSPRRSRRRSGGNLTLGLPGSSTEQPIPWFLRGYPPSRWFVPVRRRLKSHRWHSGRTDETSDLPPVFPGNPLPCHRRCAVSTAGGRIPSIATRALWRHLATSTSHRSAVLRLSAQDGHRSHRNFVPRGSR